MRDAPQPAEEPLNLTRRTALAGVAATTVLSTRLVRPRRPSEIGGQVLASSPATGFFARQANGPGSSTTSVALVNAATGSVMSGVNAVSLFAQRSGTDLVDSVVSTDGRTTVRTLTSFISGADGRVAHLQGEELGLEQATELYGVVEQLLSPDGRYVALYCESPQLTSRRGTKASPLPVTGVVRACVSVCSVSRRQLVARFMLPTDQTFTAGTGGCLSWDPSGSTLHVFITRYAHGSANAATYTLRFDSQGSALIPTKLIQRTDLAVPLSAPQSSQMTYTSGDLGTVVAVRGNVLYAYDTSSGKVVSCSDITTMPTARNRPLDVDVLATADHRYVLTLDKATGAVSVYDTAHRRFAYRSSLQVAAAPQFRSLALVPDSTVAVVADPGPKGGALVVSLPAFKVLDRLASGTRVSSVTTAANRIVLKHENDAAVTTYPSAGGGGSTIRVPATLTSVL
jgi:hypothetical protein